MNQCFIPTENSRGHVITSDKQLGIQYLNSGAGRTPVARPVWGNEMGGYHWQPETSSAVDGNPDQVLVTHEVRNAPNVALPYIRRADQMTAMAAGESAQFHRDGSIADWLKHDHSAVVYQNVDNTASVNCDTSANLILAGIAVKLQGPVNLNSNLFVAGFTTLNNDVTAEQHLYVGGTTVPSAVVHAGGTGSATVTGVNVLAGSNDQRGMVQFTLTLGAHISEYLVDFTYSTTLNTDTGVVVCSASLASGTVVFGQQTATSTGFTLWANGGDLGISATSVQVAYMVLG